FEQPNPGLDLANSPFYVNTKLSPWKNGAFPRRAGVSAFGVGGTNAHVILEEAPKRERLHPGNPPYLIVLSAKTEAALDQISASLAGHLKSTPDIDLADVAYTLQTGRRHFQHRRMFVCRDSPDAVDVLETGGNRPGFAQKQLSTNPSVAFMFPGQ